MSHTMSRSNVRAAAAPLPSTLQIGVLRAGLGLAVVASLLAVAVRAQAQTVGGNVISVRPTAGAPIVAGPRATTSSSPRG